MVGLNSFFGFALPPSRLDSVLGPGLEFPPRVKSLSPLKEGSLPITAISKVTSQTLELKLYYLPGLLAVKGEIAACNESFFTKSEVDGLPDTKELFLFPSLVDCVASRIVDFGFAPVGLTSFSGIPSFLLILKYNDCTSSLSQHTRKNTRAQLTHRSTPSPSLWLKEACVFNCSPVTICVEGRRTRN